MQISYGIVSNAHVGQLTASLQGTILGPILFIIYINEISSNLTSTVKIYSDDTKVYCVISEPEVDPSVLQLDLNKLMG